MAQDNIFTAPKTLELDNFVFNPLATINFVTTVYLIHREEHEIKDAMNKFTNGCDESPEKRKLVPKSFKQNSEDGKLFHQKQAEKSIIVTRITTYQLKISCLMDDLGEIIRKSSKLSDGMDCFKQKKLFADFIVRFSRNYVYEIDRIIEEIRFYQIDHYSYFERSTNHLISKVCNLFAIIVRALQIYQKQLTSMSNENSDKLIHFVELIVSGINVCIEMKIFDEDDMLMKLLLEKSDEFIDSLNKNMYDEEPPANDRKTINSLSSTSLTKEIFTPNNHRYFMYAPKSKKMIKSNKPKMSFSKIKGNGKNAAATIQSTQRSYPQSNKINTVFESQVSLGCSGNSSACDAYTEVIKQNTMQLNDVDIDAENQIESGSEYLDNN